MVFGRRGGVVEVVGVGRGRGGVKSILVAKLVSGLVSNSIIGLLSSLVLSVGS